MKAATYTTLVVLTLVGALVADMWIDPDYKRLGDIALVGAALLMAAFSALYVTRSKWWTNRIGKVYAVKSVVFAAVLTQGAVAVWWPGGDYPGRYQIRFVIFALGVVAAIPMIVSLLREQRRDRSR